MKPQFDLRFILIFFVLSAVFVAICSISALLMWVLSPRRFRAARSLLCLPLIGMSVGIPVALIGNMRPDLTVWMGTSCTSLIMLIGFFMLGIATLVRTVAGNSDSIKRSKRRADEVDND